MSLIVCLSPLVLDLSAPGWIFRKSEQPVARTVVKMRGRIGDTHPTIAAMVACGPLFGVNKKAATDPNYQPFGNRGSSLFDEDDA